MSEPHFQNPDREIIHGLLATARTIAVVGLSPLPHRPSHQVARALRDYGYRIVPVRPGSKMILGETAYPDLASVPESIDLVDVFRNPSQIDPLIDACIELKIPAVWLQDGVVNVPAALRARDAGITVVMDRCTYRDYNAFRAEGRPPLGE
ncbi:MAG: CoA-binding protein [Chromatiales bacterium]|nr:CoA-binding protein [Chromatiales bacterium]